MCNNTGNMTVEHTFDRAVGAVGDFLVEQAYRNVQVRGGENRRALLNVLENKVGGAIVVSNHLSFFDQGLIIRDLVGEVNWLGSVRIGWVMNEGLRSFEKYGVKASMVRDMERRGGIEMLEVDTSGATTRGVRKMLSVSRDILGGNGVVFISPEGGRQKSLALGDIHRGGVGAMLPHAKYIFPLAIMGTEKIHNPNDPVSFTKIRLGEDSVMDYRSPIVVSEHTEKVCQYLSRPSGEKVRPRDTRGLVADIAFLRIAQGVGDGYLGVWRDAVDHFDNTIGDLVEREIRAVQSFRGGRD